MLAFPPNAIVCVYDPKTSKFGILPTDLPLRDSDKILYNDFDYGKF